MDMLGNLRLFVDAARLGSLSAAARQSGISTATASRILDRLESELGFKLLVRTSRQLALTEAGSAYITSVERLLLDFNDATEYAKGFQCEAKGQLRVHARVAVGTICVSPLIPAFLAQYPDIGIRLSLSNEANPDLIQGNFDVDIRTGRLKDSSLIARKLADSRRVMVASPDYLVRHGIPQTPYDLKRHNCLTFRNDANPVVWRFRAHDGEEIEISPKGNLETDNGTVIRQNLRAGLGIGQMTEWAVAADLERGTLIRILADYEVTVDAFDHGIYAVFLPNRQHSVKVRVFIDFLVDAFKHRTSALNCDEDEGPLRALPPPSVHLSPASVPSHPW